jgi:hypothetical protein
LPWAADVLYHILLGRLDILSGILHLNFLNNYSYIASSAKW